MSVLPAAVLKWMVSHQNADYEAAKHHAEVVRKAHGTGTEVNVTRQLCLDVQIELTAERAEIAIMRWV